MGESGTGKETIAEILHGNRQPASGSRQTTNFVPVNVTTLQEDLFESLLFGHVKGSFTGATRDVTGFVQQAHRGTLFLDEIGELPYHLQPKLLRFIQHRKYNKIGDAAECNATCRFVFSTNKDLRKEVDEGRFRLDLYFRISTYIIKTSPLRDRPQDIVLYLKHMEIPEPEQLTKTILTKTKLLGNYRELQSIVARYKTLGELIIY
tara:strand:+ start:1581 stop:2198 length:618 start_codon:yes stop_codon:yes gene_type:complete